MRGEHEHRSIGAVIIFGIVKLMAVMVAAVGISVGTVIAGLYLADWLLRHG